MFNLGVVCYILNLLNQVEVESLDFLVFLLYRLTMKKAHIPQKQNVNFLQVKVICSKWNASTLTDYITGTIALYMPPPYIRHPEYKIPLRLSKRDESSYRCCDGSIMKPSINLSKCLKHQTSYYKLDQSLKNYWISHYVPWSFSVFIPCFSTNWFIVRYCPFINCY